MADIKSFLAGFGAGVLSCLVHHPLDTLKVRQQTYNCGVFTALTRTLKYEGVRGLYTGISLTSITWGPSNSLFFGVYENCLQLLASKPKTVELHYHETLHKDNEFLTKVFCSGCVAGLPQAIFYCPVEYIKIILQARTSSKAKWKVHYVVPYTGAMEAVKGIYKDSGIKGLYRGIWLMLIRDVPTSGLYVWTYEIVRYNALDDLISSIETKQIIAGGMAGITCVGMGLPVDVVKTIIQTDNPNKPIYNGMVDCTRKLYAEYGWRIFFTGLPVLCLRAFPANAVMFATYGFFMTF